jgi:HlyD family secretion protein
MAEREAAGRGSAGKAGTIPLVAPMNGRIVTLLVRQPGAVMNAGDPLLTIVPDHAPLVLEAWIANQDMADMRVGLPAVLKIDAYPYEQYGTVPATVTWVSPDVETHPTLGAAYRIKCTPGESSIPLRPGLTGTVEVVTGRKRVLDLLLAQVLGRVEKGSVRGR